MRRVAKVVLLVLGLAWAAAITRSVARLDLHDDIRKGGA